ncbi:MAG: lysophospholipid acyltransferase family protein [Pseudomonadota bacterium]
MRTMKTLAYTPWKWLVAIPGIALSTLFFGTACLLLLLVLPPRRVNRFIPVWWARVNLALIPVAVNVHGREHLEPGQSYLIAANHLSHIDILALYATPGLDLRFVMKQELRKVPVIGVVCAGLGYIYVNRSNRHEAVRSLNAAKPRLTSDGASVIFFPEGTRSVDGRLHDFKKGAFVTARDMNLPILPVTLRGSDGVLPAKTLGLLPGRVDVIIHRPISAAQVQNSSAEELMTQTRAVIAGVLPPDRIASD